MRKQKSADIIRCYIQGVSLWKLYMLEKIRKTAILIDHNYPKREVINHTTPTSAVLYSGLG